MISIVIPLYNKEKQIKNTLQSVFAQTFQDYEIVIVNDGSTDKSAEIVKTINDSRIRIIEQENQGVSSARNTGIKESKYEYIALLDADDEWKPNYLETQVDLIRSFPNCSVFACVYEFKKGTEITPLILNKIPFEGEKGELTNYFEVAACSHPPICSINIVAKKEAFFAIGGFPVGVKSGEDLITWAKLAIHYSIAYSLLPLAVYVQDETYLFSSKHIKKHDDNNYVEEELKKLYHSTKGKLRADLKKYISLWYKMRASVFMRMNKKRLTYKYSFISLYYNFSNFKVYAFLIIVLLPSKFQHYIRKQHTR